MPSILARTPSAVPRPKKKFSTVLGLQSLSQEPLPNDEFALPLPIPPRRRPKPIDEVFFEHIPAPLPPPPARHSDVMPNQRPQRLTPVAANEDGPWSVSVAETPNEHPRASYSIYVKTPTHHLTLTRSAHEIIDLHEKLRDTSPAHALPKLPIDASAPPPKRRSSFLHTLSRLASSSAAGTKSPSSVRVNASSSSAHTPIASPSAEVNDPFASPLSSPPLQSPTTGLGSYLTAISNDPNFRSARVWRKFVRVRTDDLQSVRVERAIKRVRSDIAVHHGTAGVLGSSSMPSSSSVSVVCSDVADGSDSGVAAESAARAVTKAEDIKEEDEGEAVAEEQRADTPSAANGQVHEASGLLTPSGSDSQEPVLPTPAASPPSPNHHTIRIPRSASADPDKAQRLSRMWKSSPSPLKAGQDDTETEDGGDGDDGETEQSEKASLQPKKRGAARKSRKVVIDDFEMMRVLGKGCAGKVLLVRHKASTSLYALKAITKRHVLAHQELQHTLTEQAVLKRMAHDATDPFVVKLWWSFHDKENLFLVMDFHPGGDLATQLARWGRLGRDRARFYAAEIVEGVEGLHAAGVIYRDLKPENILIGGDGHIVLTDFGLSKEFPRPSNGSGPLPTAPSTPSASGRSSNGSDYYASSTGSSGSSNVLPSWMRNEGGAGAQWGSPSLSDVTNTFCGTAEYLAPEVIQGLPYSYVVDWWSFGTMLFEMLTGITPFWANNHSDMYVRVLQDELHFPDDRALDQDTKSLIRGLLQRNPSLRLSEPRIKRHPYFSMIDWSHVYFKRYIPPYIPPIDPSNASDTQNFDDTFLDMDPTLDNEPEPEPQTDSDRNGDDEKTDGEESVVKTPPAQTRSPVIAVEEDTVDVFDGYSFKGRNSVIIDDDDETYDGPQEADIPEAEPSLLEAEEVDVHGEGVSTPHPEPSPSPTTPMTTPIALPVPEVAVDIPAPTPPQVVEAALSKPPPPPPSPSTISVEIDPALRDLVTDPSFLDREYDDADAKITASPAPAAVPLPATPPQPVADVTPKATAPKDVGSSKPVVPASKGHRKWRTERSGVAALDRNLGDIMDEDEEYATEREDDDWDFIERPGGEEINGNKATSLFARGVVDRYRLAVFRKSSATANASRAPAPTSRSVSGVSVAESEDASPSPTPSDKPRTRGRTSGLSLRKTKQFLRARSPAATFSTSSSAASRSHLSQATSATISVSNTGLLTPSPSVPLGHALKTKMSSTSVAPSSSSDQSASGDLRSLSLSQSMEFASPARSPSDGEPRPLQQRTSSAGETPEKPKARKLKKYREGAEKVFSLFGSPRQ